MYTNISKAQAFPLASKISSQPRCLNSPLTLKLQSLHLTCQKKSFQNPNLKNSSYRFGSFCLMNLVNSVTHLQHGTLEMGKMIKFGIRYCRGRSFCSSYAEKKLPWLVSNELKEDKVVEKAKTSRVSRSFQKGSVKKEVSCTSKSSWEQSIEKLEKAKSEFFCKPASSAPAITISAAASTGRKNGLIERFDGNVEVGDEEEEMAEAVDDPRWDNIKSRFKGMRGEKVGPERHEFRRLNRQENWGRKTWKEATESTVPKIVDEGIYGVGPVLAALSAGRREFYVLYVRE
ncbi:putative 50S ribosomal protein L30e [Lupinus albus]|uniref:Putative 50S ribosomal protein L30e n=1 Tax=Lupinus albus TaxID=3870 RepID=A0A6A4Q1C8_LUPAL|nr:putative 50S ribosomal protein L30e [Lupinus albus]